MDKKRGRKKKLVNLDNDAENLLDSGNQEEIIILTLLMSSLTFPVSSIG